MRQLGHHIRGNTVEAHGSRAGILQCFQGLSRVGPGQQGSVGLHGKAVHGSAGIGLCLDDFGSGYANLNSVLKLPFSVIKMDRSLLSDICTDEKAAALYRNTVSVLRNMGYTVVAEGVETLAELELLSSWGVDMIQGFYFSPPVSRSKLLELLLPKTDAAKNCLA